MMGTKNNVSYRNAKPVHIGAFVYSYSRRHMYLAVLSKVSNKILTDTDSIVVDKDCDEMLQLLADSHKYVSLDPLLGTFGVFHLGDKLGDFEDEIEHKLKIQCDEVVAIAPKSYILVASTLTKNKIGKLDYHHKLCFKGIGARDKLYETAVGRNKISQKNFKKLSIETKSEIYKSLDKALTLENYRLLANGVNLTCICSQVKRCVDGRNGKKPFTMYQCFTHKTVEGLSNPKSDPQEPQVLHPPNQD